MDASAIVKSSDHRPTLGKVSVGPLGATHQEVLDDILAKQRRSNPLKVCNDAINDCFLGIMNCCEAMLPTRVSPEMMAEQTRPMKSETIATLSCLLGVVITAVILMLQIADSATVSSDWESTGRCEVLDIVQSAASSDQSKLLMRVIDEGWEEDPQRGILYTEHQNRLADFLEHLSHHPTDSPNPEADDTPDNPFSCHIEKTKVEEGPCCHSAFNTYRDFQIGDQFDCFFTFKTKYCNTIDYDLEDDDFRGFGPGPHTPEQISGPGNPVEVHDHLNQICCEPELPIDIAAMMISFVLCCVVAAVIIWCLLFRAKQGVW
eukprot:CAMPEP_0197561164 /NCGR_PEP_ID=MMETSP1320-20131121/24602_1 /TAXON_ID=91990 /ORGANISM="Bolidomonas sp., Strain RCC2347" /LENGTH=317 /DNA_ID=CAMNT_0043122775 /DNA_START=146 /DNA_END=1096 /DNA_ORIENTATION=+